MRFIGLFFSGLVVGVGATTAYLGVVEFDHAVTFLPLFRGLFWLSIGTFEVWLGLARFRDSI